MARVAAIRSGTVVFIRRPRASDTAAFVALARASRSRLHPFAHPPDTPEAFHRYLGGLRSSRRRGYLVCRREDAGIVGVANLSEIVRGGFQSAYLGYYGLGDTEGRGYMTEGLALVVLHAFSALKLHRVEANIQPSNTRSIRLVERLGFRREGFSPAYLKIAGEWRDHERWAILADEIGPRAPARPG